MDDYSRQSDLRKYAMLTPEEAAKEGNPDEDRRTLLGEMSRASSPRIRAALQYEYDRRFNGGPRSPAATSMRDGFPELTGRTPVDGTETATAPSVPKRMSLTEFLANDQGAPAAKAQRMSLTDYLNSIPDPVAPARTTRTMGEAITDTGRGVAAGVAGLVKFPGDLYGLAAGDMENPVSKFGKQAQEYFTEGQSQVLKDKIAARKAAIDASDSTLGKFGTALKETLTDPALLGDVVSSNLTTMIPGMAAGKMVQGSMAARALAAGPITEAAALAAAKSGAKVATGAAVGMGALQQGADVSSQAYDDSVAKFNTPEKIAAQLAANPMFAARVQAGEAPKAVAMSMGLDAARAAFLPATAISVAANAIPGGTMLERALIGGAARDTLKAGAKYALPKAIAKGMLGEGTQETIEEGGGQYAANIAKQSLVDPKQDLFENVGENAGLGAAGGIGMGGVGGAFHRSQAPVKTAGDIIRTDLQPGTGPLTNALNAGIEQAAQKADAAHAADPTATVPFPPREITPDMIAAIRKLAPAQQEEALKYAALGNDATVVPGVRRFAQNRLTVMLGEIQPSVAPTADSAASDAAAPPVVAPGAPGNAIDQQLAELERTARAAEAPAAVPEPTAAPETAAAPALMPDAANGFVAAPDGYRVRIGQHELGSNFLDPQADAGAFTYEVQKGQGDATPLNMVLNKDGKLVTTKSVLTGNSSNGTAWIPPSAEAADKVRVLLGERAQMKAGSTERFAIDLQIVDIVKPAPAAPAPVANTSQAGAIEKRERDRPAPITNEPISGDIMGALGKPFRNMDAAMSAQTKAGGEGTHDIVRVSKGLVVRPKQTGAVNELANDRPVGRPDGAADTELAARTDESGRADPVGSAGDVGLLADDAGVANARPATGTALSGESPAPVGDANPANAALTPGAPAVAAVGEANDPKPPAVDKFYESLIGKASTEQLSSSGGRTLHRVTVSPLMRNKHHDSRGRFPETESFALKHAAEVTGNPSDNGYILIDKRQQAANRAVTTEAPAAPTNEAAPQSAAPVRTPEIQREVDLRKREGALEALRKCLA